MKKNLVAIIRITLPLEGENVHPSISIEDKATAAKYEIRIEYTGNASSKVITRPKSYNHHSRPPRLSRRETPKRWTPYGIGRR